MFMGVGVIRYRFTPISFNMFNNAISPYEKHFILLILRGSLALSSWVNPLVLSVNFLVLQSILRFGSVKTQLILLLVINVTTCFDS